MGGFCWWWCIVLLCNFWFSEGIEIASVCVFIDVIVCSIMCTYTYMCIHICVCVCICGYVLVYLLVQLCVSMCMCVYVYTCVCTCVHASVCICACVYTWLFVCIYAHVCVCVSVCVYVKQSIPMYLFTANYNGWHGINEIIKYWLHHLLSWLLSAWLQWPVSLRFY